VTTTDVEETWLSRNQRCQLEFRQCQQMTITYRVRNVHHEIVHVLGFAKYV